MTNRLTGRHYVAAVGVTLLALGRNLYFSWLPTVEPVIPGMIPPVDESRLMLVNQRMKQFEALSPPDFRHPECPKSYPSTQARVTVVIPYLKEPWRFVFLTLSSLINNTDLGLIQEILVVDDGNPKETEFGPEIRKMHRLITHVRTGDRPVGVAQVKNFALKLLNERSNRRDDDVVVFSEPHTLYNVGWLEPLLHQIQKNPKTHAVPILDVIGDPEFHVYSKSNVPQIGGFDWSLTFLFRETIMKRNATWVDPEPYPSPASPGGIFAMNLKFLTDLGGYDPDITSWGGENAELSFKVWRCGGQIIFVTCSRVGHYFRSSGQQPYLVKLEALMLNKKRVASVWLDQYYPKFIEIHEQDKLNPVDIHTLETGDISSRIALKSDLQCHSMDWYIKHVYPELGVQPLQLPILYDVEGEVRPPRTRSKPEIA